MASKVITAQPARFFNIDRGRELAEVVFGDDDGSEHRVGLSKAEAFAVLTMAEQSAIVSIMNKWSAAAQAKRGFQ